MKLQNPKTLGAIAATLVIAGICAGCFLRPTQHSEHRPIHDFARDGNLTLVIQDLATNAADLNLPDDAGLTPLHLASLHCHTNVVAFLLQKGARVDATAEDDTTPLHLAAQEGCIDVATLLLKGGAKVNARDGERRTPLDRAEAWHKTNTVVWLKTQGGVE
jgi:ankyrin repeat protein